MQFGWVDKKLAFIQYKNTINKKAPNIIRAFLNHNLFNQPKYLYKTTNL